jgi:pSer/pThr/pTyr-binding forkhead associated (FHA) protein
LKSPSNNLIVEVIAGPTGADLMSYVVARGTTRVFGGSHRKSSEEMTPLSDGGMSVPHFRITNRGDSILLKDCESRNGTIVDGRKVTEQIIEEGTTFKAGRTQFQVRWEKPPELAVQKVIPIEVEATQDSFVLPELPRLDGGESELLSSDYVSPVESSMMDAPQLPVPVPLEKIQDFEGSDELVDVVSDHQLPGPITSSDGENQVDILPATYTRVESFDPYRSGASNVVPVVRLILPTTALWSDFDRVIRDLGLRYDLYAIAHLAKLPDHRGDSRAGIALFPHLDPVGSGLPVGIEKHDWFMRFHNQIGERLVAVDGLLVAICKSNTPEVADSLRSLGSAAITGISELGGFVPWCWPSGLHGILDSLSDARIARWMGESIDGLIFPHRDRIFAYARPDRIETLLAIGFQ